ncbi:MAG: diadenylate cyclase CdaA [bacterium]|nr:diadenylate cyclase CdaA [bacterium]
MGFIKFRVVNAFEIIILSAFIYYFFSFIKGTKALQMMIGVVSLFVLAIISEFLKFDTLSFIFKGLWTAWIIILVFLFQPELRNALARLGARFGKVFTQEIKMPIDELTKTVFALSEKKEGAIIVIEREVSLKDYIDTGQLMESRLSSEIILTVFTPLSPLHDGAVIVRGNTLVAAACILPVSEKPLVTEIGTRHRAALGLSEETDAVCIIVSEETGHISIAVKGELITNIPKTKVKQELYKQVV